MKYDVTIEETVVETVTIEAASPEAARRLVEAGYKAGKYVLAPGELTDVAFVVEGKRR